MEQETKTTKIVTYPLLSLASSNGVAKGVYFIIFKGAQYYTLQKSARTQKNLLFCMFGSLSDQAFPNDVSLLAKNTRVLAKFKAFMNHLVNKCDNFEDPLFKTCAQ